MKRLTLLKGLLFALLALALSTTQAMAKKKVIDKMYMFGFSASFKDSTVYFTDVQEVNNVWFDTKNKFLLGREFYSEQLKDFLSKKRQLPARTCVVMFDSKQKKAEKKLLKMKRLYTVKAKGKYEVQYLGPEDFKFKTLDLDFSEQ